MARSVNSGNTTTEKRSTEGASRLLLLGGVLAIGFLLGYVASAFFPLVLPSPSPTLSTSTSTAARLSPSEIGVSLKAAHALLDAGDIQAAWEKYHQILMTDPHHVEALAHLGNVLVRSNRLDEAIRLYDKVLTFDANYAHALFDKGNALKEKGDVKGASEAWQRFLALVPAGSDDAKRVQGWIAELGRSGAPAKKDGGARER